MEQNLFHYLGKRPLKVTTELSSRAEEEEQPGPFASEAIELPPAGATSIGRNIPGAQADAADVAAAAEAAAEAEQAAQMDALQAIGASGEWPGADFNEGPDVPDQIIAVGDAADGDGVSSADGADSQEKVVSTIVEEVSEEREPSTFAQPWRNNPLLMALVGSLIAVYLAWNAGGFVDNDVWFILATGREIFENGIPYVNPFAMHDGMGIVVQQWVPCLIAYGVYSLGGFVALGLWCAVLATLVVVSLYRLGRLLKADRYGGEWILLAIALVVPALLNYLSMRPHMYTMLAFCWLLFFMVKFRRTGKVGWLAGAVALVAAHVNFQMALAPMDLVIIACFAVPDVLAPFHKRGRLMDVQLADMDGKHWPVLLCVVVAAVALLANPYGIDGALYLVNSYGAAEYGNFIREMRAFAPWDIGFTGMCSVAVLVLGAMAAGKRGLRDIDLPLTLLAFGVGLAAFSHTRNLWLIAFFALPLIFSVMHGWSLDFLKLPMRGHAKRRRKTKDATERTAATTAERAEANEVALADPEAVAQTIQRRRAIALGLTVAVCLGGAIATGALLWQAVPTWQNYEKESDKTPSGLLDYLEKAGVDPQNVRLFNPFNIGGYLEWRGYTVFMDPRPELWTPGISGQDTNYYEEYVDMLTDEDWTDRDFAEFLAKYDFQYLIVDNESRLAEYLKDFRTDYMSLLGTGNYTLWGKKDMDVAASAGSKYGSVAEDDSPDFAANTTSTAEELGSDRGSAGSNGNGGASASRKNERDTSAQRM